MMQPPRFAVFGAMTFGCLLTLAAPAAEPPGYAFTGCGLFDGAGEHRHLPVAVTVRGLTIEAVLDPGEKIPSDLEPIDCAGYTLMPGLIDAHTHLDSEAMADRALASGVTTVRTAGVPAYQDVALRELARSGVRAGPDVVAAGVFVTPDLEDTLLADPRLAPLAGGVDSEDALRLLVRINAERGANVIKTRGTERAGRADTDPRQQVYSERQLAVIVDEAGRHGMPVMVHAHGDEGARAAVLAGARSIEHGTYLSTATLQLMKERGTWFVPTLITMIEMNEGQYDHVLRLRALHMVPQLEAAIREGHRLGVRFATGADNYYDEKSVNRPSLEVMHFVRLGLSPFEALQAATASAADLLEIGDRTGRIAPGFEADLILVPGDPLADVSVLQDVLLVMSNGRIALRRIPFAHEE